MKNPDVTLTRMRNNVLRVSFLSLRAKNIASNEPDIAPHLNRRDGFVFMDVKNTITNKNNVILYCVSHNLRSIEE